MGYKTNCPQCGGNDFYVTPDKEIYGYCFHCSYSEFGSGSHSKQSVRYKDVPAIRQLYTELAAYYHSSMTEQARQYLNNRGITDQEINDLMIGYCPDSGHILYNNELAKEAGIAVNNKPFLYNRIIFPYRNSEYITDLRGRSLDPNEKVRYKSPFNSAFYRGADYPFYWQSDSELITEGEIKTIYARRAGYKAIGIPGVTNKRPNSVFRIVIFDNDPKQAARYAVQRSIMRLVERVPDLLIATLPEYGGLDDYINKYGIEKFRRIIRSALPYNRWRNIFVR